jgi:anti-sigma factor RsiW
MDSSLRCRGFVEFLDDYLSGRLSAGERRRFDAHLATCPSCVAYMRTYSQAILMGRGALLVPEAPRAGDAPEELVRAILAARERES